MTKGQADAFEVAVRDFARDCLTHSDCPLSGTTDQAVGAAAGVADGAGRESDPLPATAI